MEHLRAIVESHVFRTFILILILANAVGMGLEATPGAAAVYGESLTWLYDVSQAIFVAEILARWLACSPPWTRFFRESWNRFDFVIVALSLVPAVGDFALVARVLRVLRVLRVVSVADVLSASVLRRHHGMRLLAFTILLILVFGYTLALAGYHLFGETLDAWSSLARSVRSPVTAFTPGQLSGLSELPVSLALFHVVLYLIALAIAVNAALSLRQRKTETAT